ncbi:MAG TPA: tetraacyldisaccharide 4'-kinase [Bacteroidales bacterium]|nr:MAG: Tetraacyldisaccharide 4'-kinase [Bacteroidetes bacterium ADurb.Bin217]HPM11876.1 tetraacyldisaccharide 4'-kinase [Bacteroidales bacterium]
MKFQRIFCVFSPLYWTLTYLRNKAYDTGLYSSTSFTTPTICVGNITVGGTGKTPHVEYICSLLQDTFRTAILSRGYKRKTKGYLLASPLTTVDELGDEPYFLYKKLQKTNVAVCEKRVLGVTKLLQDNPTIQAIILDDAFQHRAIKSGLNIVLIDYNRPIWNDCVFPGGMLREGTYALERAHSIIITKCPNNLTNTEMEMWKRKLHITKQTLFFTTIKYTSIYEAESKKQHDIPTILSSKHILLVTGIAQPKPMYTFISQYCKDITHLNFADHHIYTNDDYALILQQYKTYRTTIVTTEKDAPKILEITRNQLPIYVLSIGITFLNDSETEFQSLIQTHISK